MRLSDLLASTVYDADGTSLGRVRDVRLVQDGPLIDGVQAAFRIDAVLAGGGLVGTRVGFGRGGVRGPAVLRWLFTRSERKARLIPMAALRWEQEARALRARSQLPRD
jgi:PRC-barrel domain